MSKLRFHLVNILAALFFFSCPSHARDLPSGGAYFDENVSFEVAGSCERAAGTVYEFVIVNGKRIAAEKEGQQVKRAITNSGVCLCSNVQDVLQIYCTPPSRSTPNPLRRRYGSDLARGLDLLGVLFDPSNFPDIPLETRETDFNVSLSKWSIPTINAVLGILAHVADGGFRHDNRAASETLDGINANLDLRLKDLKNKQIQLQETFERQNSRALEILSARLRLLPQNLNAAIQQHSFQDRQRNLTKRTIDQRIDAALGLDFDTARLKREIEDLLDRVGASSASLVTPGLNTRLFKDEIDAIYPPSAPRQHAINRETIKQDKSFAKVRDRVRTNRAVGRSDPVFSVEVELDVVEMYARSRLILADQIRTGQDSRAHKLDQSEKDRLIDNLLEDARSGRYFAEGILSGVRKSVVETLDSLVNLPSSAIEIYQNAGEIAAALTDVVVNYEDSASIIRNAIKREWYRFDSGDEFVKGEIIGGIIGDAMQQILGGKAVVGTIRRLKEFGKLGKFERAAKKLEFHFINERRTISRALQAVDPLVTSDPVIRRHLISFKEVYRSQYLGGKLAEETAGRLAETVGKKFTTVRRVLDDARAANTPISAAAKDYLGWKAYLHGVSETFDSSSTIGSKETYARIVSKYHKIDDVISNSPKVSFDTLVSRGVRPRNVEPTSHLQIFASHKGLTGANGRYSGPGEAALYGAIGPDNADIARTIRAELRASQGEIIEIGTKRFNLNLLDLTKPRALNRLGVSRNDIIVDVRNRPGYRRSSIGQRSKILERVYEDTHIIGHVARLQGFDGIKTFSAAKPSSSSSVIVIFR